MCVLRGSVYVWCVRIECECMCERVCGVCELRECACIISVNPSWVVHLWM